MKPKPSCRLEPTACTAIGWKMRLVQMTEDTAGNRWFLEFDAGSTAPVRRWVERPQRVYIPSGEVGSEQLYIIDYQWEFINPSDNQCAST